MKPPQSYPWRPLGSADLAALHATLSGPFLLWKDQWFVDGIVDLSEGEYVAPARVPASLSRTPADQALPFHLDCPPAARMALGALALDTTATSMTTAAAPERAVIEAFCDAMMLDLANRLELLAGAAALDAGGFRQGAAHFTLQGAGAEPPASIWLSLPLVRQWVRPQPTAQGDTERLVSRPIALQESAVSIEALLGTAKLTLAELRRAEIGDVIRMSARLDDDVPLFLTHGGLRAPLASAALARDDAAFALQIHTIHSETR